MDLVSSLPTELPADKEGIIIIGVPNSCIKHLEGLNYIHILCECTYMYIQPNNMLEL